METAAVSNAIFEALEKFINERPNLDPANYGLARGQTPDRIHWWECQKIFREEKRSITADGTRARKALKEARNYPPNLDALKEAFTRAFSGRLELTIAACTCQPCEKCMAVTVCGVCHHCTRHGNHVADCPGCPEGTISLDYCTGQYYPTEYRKAAAAVLEYYCHEVRPKFTPPEGTLFTSISQIKQASYNVGSHYFDASTMRFFNSRVLPNVYHGPGGIYFVTSEKGPSNVRAYTVRKFDPKTADIKTFGKFNELSRERALRFARIAAHEPAAALEAMSI